VEHLGQAPVVASTATFFPVDGSMSVGAFFMPDFLHDLTINLFEQWPAGVLQQSASISLEHNNPRPINSV
jgi:hypothetical protein